MSTKSQNVSWMGVSLGVVQGLLKEVQKLGGGDEDIRKLVMPEGESLLAKFAQMLVGVARQIYNVMVDRTKTLSEMIKAGKYGWVNADITQEHFPVAGSCKKEEGFVLFHFNRNISSEKAITEIVQAGCEPGDIADLLAFGADQPELQRQFPIVALNLKSVWRGSGGDRHVPGLCGGSADRGLGLRCFEGDWDERYRFLARRKYQK